MTTAKPRKLSLDQAQNRYPHRYTMQHKPSWACLPRPDGAFYAPQFRSDQEWYDNTTFPGESGMHSNAKWCRTSGQTWPLGKTLAEPFKVR